MGVHALLMKSTAVSANHSFDGDSAILDKEFFIGIHQKSMQHPRTQLLEENVVAPALDPEESYQKA